MKARFVCFLGRAARVYLLETWREQPSLTAANEPCFTEHGFTGMLCAGLSLLFAARTVVLIQWVLKRLNCLLLNDQLETSGRALL